MFSFAEALNFKFDEESFLNLISYAVLVQQIFVFVILFYVPAYYGRYQSKSLLYSFKINAKASWFLQECPAFFIPLLCLLSTDIATIKTPNFVIVLLFIIHYFQRTFVYTFKMKTTSQTPLFLFLWAFFYVSLNGYLQGRYHIEYANYNDSWMFSAQFIIGICLFFIGFAINLHSDSILRNLRSHNKSGYKIPYGGLFTYISCANYFGEIVEWFGYSLAAGSLASLSFVSFTIANLLPRAIQHHRWYKEKFKEEYPAKRKAIIPFLI